MIRNLIAAIVAFSLFSAPATSMAGQTAVPFVIAKAPVNTGDLQLFATEAAAQAHCLKDTVVWLNTATGIWHEKGMRWYGNTKHGAYVCRADADSAGDRDTRNGQ